MSDLASFFLDQARTSPHIQFLYDLAQQRVVFVNPAYEQVLQGQCDRVNNELPQLLARLHPDDLPLLQRYWQLWQQGRLHDEVEVRLTTPGAVDHWFCLTPYWRSDEHGASYLGGTLRDITTSKRNWEVSDKFNTKKNTVLEILAHDLVGSFAQVQQVSEYVHPQLAAHDNPRVPELLHLLSTTAQHNVQLIHDLVDQEFLAAAEIPLRRERVDLRDKVAQCLEPFRRALGPEARQIALEAPAEPVYASIDVNKLLQVVSNLVANALKFTPDEGRVTVRLEPANGHVRLQVADTGIGIPEKLLPEVFERFTKARRPGLRGEPTTGLGLSLCKTIVALHQGTLAVRSVEGQGTTFTVLLPVPVPQA